MTTFFEVLIGVAVGITLLAAVVVYAFRQKPKKEKPWKTAENYDVFEKDPSYYSSVDKPNN